MAVATRPLFREDLLAEAVDDGGARFVDVMDDATGVVFRFYETEYSLACAMDGQRDVDAIVAWAETELGLRPQPTEVKNVIAKLEELGYLRDATAAAANAPAAEAAPDAAALGFEPPRSLTMGWDAIDAAALSTGEPPPTENPHEVITKPSAKVDLDEPTPPPGTGAGSNPAIPVAATSGSKPEIPVAATSGSKPEIPVAATSGSNPGIAVAGSSPGIARVGVVSVPVAKAVVPPKQRVQTPVPTAKTDEDEESTKIASDEDLAMGVVVAPQSSSPKIPVENVELGHVERSESGERAATTEVLSGYELELGSSGAVEKAAEPPKAPVEDLGLGVAGPGVAKKEPVSEVSIALADHAAIDASDVRDAVRASQVMKAVNPDDIEALEKEAAAEAAAAKAAESKADTADKADDKAAKDDIAAAREKKEKAAAERAAANKDTYEGRRLPANETTSDARPSKLKYLIAVAVLAAGAALVYNFALKKSDDARPVASEKSAADIEAEKAAAEAAAAKVIQDKADAEKLAAEKAEAERLAAEKLAAEQAGSGSADSGSAGSGSAGSADPAGEKAAADKLAAEKLAAEKLAAEKLAAEQAAADAAQKLAADKAAADQAATDKAAADKAAADKAAADKAAADKAAADKAAADKAAADAAAAGAGSDADAAREAAKKAARAKARAAAAAREKAEMEKLLEKQRKALEERKKQQEAAGGGAAAPAPTP